MQDGIFIPESTEERRFQDWFFNPFRCVSRAVALVAGIAIIFISAALCSLAPAHFNGVLAAEYYSHAAPPWLYIAEGLTAWLSMALALQLFGAIVAPERFGFIDLLGTQALARWPYIFLALVALLPGGAQALPRSVAGTAGVTSSAGGIPITICVWVVLLGTTAWAIVLMYRGYVLSTGLERRKAVLSFGMALILAQIVAKVICIVMATNAGVLTRTTPI
jgi:hypothetical protein